MPGLDQDQVRHTEQIVYGIVNAKYDVLTVKIDGLRTELLAAIEKPRHCPAHEGVVLAVDRLDQATKEANRRRQMFPTWVQVIVAACVAVGTIVWTWTQIALAHAKP